MADLTWKRSEIRDRWRELTGRNSISDIADADVDALINDYYVNYFPEDVLVTNFDGFFTQEALATDNGEYSLAQSIVKLMEPMTINGAAITFYQDKNYFFQQYPDDEQYITSPSLAIGSVDTMVSNIAFKYNVNRVGYSKASVDTDLTGLSIVPQNKYGAYLFQIDSSGIITVIEASDYSGDTVIGTDLNEYRCITAHVSAAATRPATGVNYLTVWVATGNTGLVETWVTANAYVAHGAGYNAQSLAIDALPAGSAGKAVMGFVTVICTAVAGFIPGTTALDAGTVTATYTNGDPAKRGMPSGALCIHNKLFLRSKADDIYQFKAASEMNRPAPLADDAAVPGDMKWGPAIALGAAILYLAPRGGKVRIEELTGIPNFSMAEYILSSIRTKKRLSMRGRVAEPSF